MRLELFLKRKSCQSNCIENLQCCLFKHEARSSRLSLSLHTLRSQKYAIELEGRSYWGWIILRYPGQGERENESFWEKVREHRRSDQT